MKRKILYIIIFVVILLFGLIYFLNVRINLNLKLQGDLNLQKFEVLDSFTDAKAASELGNYIFLMSPSPNDDNNNWYENPSFLFVTDQEYNILNVVKLNGYFEEMSLEGNKLYLYTKDIKENDYINKLDTPVQMSATYQDGKYSNFKASSDDVSDIASPVVGLTPNQITLIDQNQVLSLEDPKFTFNNHEYYIVDFVQNINSIQTEAIKESNQK